MKAIVRKQYGGTDQLEIKEVPNPVPVDGEILIRVRAFGINRAEIYMRKGLWGEVAAISGIECVGEVASDPAGKFEPGLRVAALMGGMGRSRNGSYAEFTCVPISNVVALQTDMSWPELAAIPESYATAWSCLHDNLQLRSGDSLVIRGGTSALGQAAINIAANTQGTTVIATTRDPEHIGHLQELGCSDVLLETADLGAQLRERIAGGIDGVLDLIGNSTLLDSMKMVKKRGAVCNAGFLGGPDPILFNPLSDMPSGVNLNFFGSFMFGSPGFSLDEVPLQQLVDQSQRGHYKNKPAAIFAVEDIAEAHKMMEANRALGKIVVQF